MIIADNYKVLFIWSRERSGSSWLQRLIQQNFERTIIVVRWKHLSPSLPSALRELCLNSTPVASETAHVIAAELEKNGKPGFPQKVHLSDDIASSFAISSEKVDQRIKNRVAQALETGEIVQVGIIKHPENWWPSILDPWGGRMAHMRIWLQMAQWQLQLRDAGRMILFRWEDLLSNLSLLAQLEKVGLPRATTEWQNERRIVGCHALPPAPDQELFQARSPVSIPPKERNKVPDKVMRQLGYQWGDPLIQI